MRVQCAWRDAADRSTLEAGRRHSCEQIQLTAEGRDDVTLLTALARLLARSDDPARLTLEALLADAQRYRDDPAATPATPPKETA